MDGEKDGSPDSRAACHHTDRIEWGDVESIKLLLEADAVDFDREWERTVVLRSFRVDDHVVSCAQHKHYCKPLFVATSSGHASITRLLLSHGADPNVRDRQERTPLFNLTKPAVTAALLEYGANANACSEDGWTPLFFADTDWKRELLLGNGADVNAQDKDGASPLLWAARRGNTRAVEMFLEHDAKVNILTIHGCSPLVGAAPHPSPEIIVLLLKHGSIVDQQDSYGNSALIYAAGEWHRNTEILIKAGANPNLQNNNGETALDGCEDPRIRKLLRKHGAKTGTELKAETIAVGKQTD